MDNPGDGGDGTAAPHLVQPEVDVFFYMGDIANEGFNRLVKAAVGDGSVPLAKHAVLILVTYGGLADDAYRIARFLQRSYESFTLLAPGQCYSAGTLVALGAHKLWVTQHTEFGPLDVQLLKQNEIVPMRRSGLLTQTAFRALSDMTFEHFEGFMLNIVMRSQGIISFRLAAELSASMTASVMSGVYGRIDPESLASDRRDVEVAIAYAFRLAKVSQNPHPHTIHNLVHNYPSHSFVIDHLEARELFQHVEEPPVHLMLILNGALSSIDSEPGGLTVEKIYSGSWPLSPVTGVSNDEPNEEPEAANYDLGSETDSEQGVRQTNRKAKQRGAARRPAGHEAAEPTDPN